MTGPDMTDDLEGDGFGLDLPELAALVAPSREREA